MANKNPKQPDGLLAFLSPKGLDELGDLIIAKPEGMNPRVLASQARLYGFEFLQALHEAGRRLAEIKNYQAVITLSIRYFVQCFVLSPGK